MPEQRRRGIGFGTIGDAAERRKADDAGSEDGIYFRAGCILERLKWRLRFSREIRLN